MTAPVDKRWELRSARRWGSAHVEFVATRAEAIATATRTVRTAGMGGRVVHVDDVARVVYFDIYPEMP